jgi:D-3-phosphoglycerate dehydrogenase
MKVALVALDDKQMPDFVPEAIRADGIGFIAQECETREQLENVANDAEIVWLFGGSQILKDGNLAAVPRCGAIVRTGSGTDNIPVAEATKHGILVANTPLAVAEAVAEHALTLMLVLVRALMVMDRAVRSGNAHRLPIRPRFELTGKKVGLLGFGHIARLVARKLSGFEVELMVYDPYVSLAQIAECGVRKTSIEELLSQSDLLSIHCPLTESTFHLIGEPQLRSMKPTAFLINTSRGPVVDEDALVRALRNGWISGAGLDVFEDESGEVNPALCAMDNVVLSPHLAGYAEENILKRWKYSLETVIDLANRRWPRSCVNPEVRPYWKLVVP